MVLWSGMLSMSLYDRSGNTIANLGIAFAFRTDVLRRSEEQTAGELIGQPGTTRHPGLGRIYCIGS
jgi:hypothetical protein